MSDATRMSWRRREITRRLLREVALERAALAAKLRELREQHDPPMTQEKAAAFIGAPARTYVRWENEEVDASLASREKIAKAYGIDPQHLISDTEPSARLTPEDLARIEAKLDRVIGFIDTLANAPERELENAVAGIRTAIATQAPPTDAQPPTAPDTPKPRPASNRRRPAHAAGKH